MTEELKPCPFCGCEMHFESNRDWHRVDGAHLPDCVFSDVEDVALMVPATKDGQAWATLAWNRRAAPAVANAAKELPIENLRDQWWDFKEGRDYGTTDPVVMALCEKAAWEAWKGHAAIASLNKPVVAMTGDECHKILKAMALDADEWAGGLSYDPTEQEISKRCVEFILAAHAGQGEKE